MQKLRSIVGLMLALALGACAHHEPSVVAAKPAAAPATNAIVRYQIADVERSIAFYTTQLGFQVDQRWGPALAIVSHGGLQLLLSGPGSSGQRPMPDGQRQAPGGWNRIVYTVDDVAVVATRLRGAGVKFRNNFEVGPGGKQIQIEDPDGNPIELFEPAK